ncbi:MAG: hypothetical protein JWP42_1702 [Pseudomonas sp.]|nr:hypothetical protein [Pseudomonas sp.]
MNRIIAALTLAGLFSTGSQCLIAAEKTDAGSAVPPSALPGLNSANGSESKEDKADKKGEEASGSNSGAESEATEKDSATSSGASKEVKKPKP